MSEAFERAFPDNPQQAAYWNVDMADKWVRNQRRIDQLFHDITERLIELAAPADGERVIDVGCGTGATCLELARAVGPDGRVLAIDISKPMLLIAERRVREAGHRHVTLLQADAQAHAFEAATADLVFSRFGVMFFSQPARAFANLLTALRPGGRLAFVCWTDVEANPWFQLPLEAAIRHLGPPEARHPRAPGPFALAEAGYVRSILDQAGFVDLRVEREQLPIELKTDLEDAAAFASEMGPAARLVRERATDAVAAARAIQGALTESFRRFETDRGMRFPAVVSTVTARVP